MLTGDSFFHLAAFGEALPGLNLCGAGRVVCLIDPVGDVYACPFAIHDEFKAGNVRSRGGFAGVWRTSDLFLDLRQPQSGGACSSCGQYDSCRGGCMAAKFFTGLPLDGPDPECVRGLGEAALAAQTNVQVPKPSLDHSRISRQSVAVSLLPTRGSNPELLRTTGTPTPLAAVAFTPRRPARACDENPLESGVGVPDGAEQHSQERGWGPRSLEESGVGAPDGQ